MRLIGRTHSASRRARSQRRLSESGTRACLGIETDEHPARGSRMRGARSADLQTCEAEASASPSFINSVSDLFVSGSRRRVAMQRMAAQADRYVEANRLDG